jgi:hypothetical protein
VVGEKVEGKGMEGKGGGDKMKGIAWWCEG